MSTDELRERVLDLYAQGLTQSEIARRLHYTPARICQVAPLRRPNGGKRPVDKRADAITLRMLQDGYSCADIARRLGVTWSAVYTRIKRLRRDGLFGL